MLASGRDRPLVELHSRRQGFLLIYTFIFIKTYIYIYMKINEHNKYFVVVTYVITVC